MNRYAFYFGIGLLSFFIGLIVVFAFYSKITDKILEKQNTDTLTSIEKNTTNSKNNDDFVTDDEILKWQKDSFKPIINKWMKNQKIEEYVELNREDGWAAYNQKYASTGLLDVDNDGIKELAIQTGCAAVGNCEFWLFKKKGRDYETILSTVMVQRYKLRKTKTKGYFDLETKTHGSATDGGISIYRYNGKEYVISKCFKYDYIVLKNDKMYELKKPIILRQKCSSDY